MTIGEAIASATARTRSVQTLQQQLEQGVVLLRYRKVTTNGGNRFALATLNPTFYAGYQFKGGPSPTRYGLIVYFDLGKRQWRSFYPFNLESYAKL